MVSEKMQPYYNEILEGWGFRNIFWTTEEDTDVAKYLDRKLHIDVLFRDPKGFRTTCQAKDLSYEFESRYQTFTVTCHKPGDNLNVERSELFTCTADYFICGYRNKNEDGVVSAVVVDFRRFREHLFTKLTTKDILDAEKNKDENKRHRYLDVGDVVFVRVPFDELIDAWPSNIVIDKHLTKEGEDTIARKRAAYHIGQKIRLSVAEEKLQEEQS